MKNGSSRSVSPSEDASLFSPTPTKGTLSGSSSREHRRASKRTSTQTAAIEPSDDIAPDFDFTGGVRGKYFKRMVERTEGVVVLDPDVARLFPDSKRVNDLLRAVGNAMKKPAKRKAG